MNFAKITIPNQVMSTEISVNISSDKYPSRIIYKDIDEIVEILKIFEKTYTRFSKESELSIFNGSSTTKVSEEMLDILNQCKKYYEFTNGIFNPSILPILEREGYIVSKNMGFTSNFKTKDNNPILDFSKLLIVDNIVFKPRNMKLDFGGIGKGYIADKISTRLDKKYDNYCVNLGGDLVCKGADLENNYNSWVIEVEDSDIAINLNEGAVATSGVDKRRWKNSRGEEKNHIINPVIKQSVKNSLTRVTVIASTAIFSDVLAKTILVMGLEKGLNYCNYNNIAAILISNEGNMYVSEKAKIFIEN